MIVIRDRPGLWWLLALMFIGVGGGFVYLGVARAFQVPWWQAALFAGMGIAAVGTGVHVAWGSPLSTIVIDSKAQELRLVQTGIFGRRVSRFRFRDIDKVVVERRRDDDGAMMGRPALEMKDGKTVSLSTLWRHDTAGMTRIIKTLRPAVIPRPGEETAEVAEEKPESTKVAEATEEEPEVTEVAASTVIAEPVVVAAIPESKPVWFADEELVEPIVVPVKEEVPQAAPAANAPAWFDDDIEVVDIDEVEVVVQPVEPIVVSEPVEIVTAVPSIDPFEPPHPDEVVERAEAAEPVRALAADEVPDPFAPGAATPAETAEAPGAVTSVDLDALVSPVETVADIAPAESVAPVEPAAPGAPASGVWAQALSDDDAEPEPVEAEPVAPVEPPAAPVDAFAAYAAEREAGGLQLVDAGGLRLVEGSPFRPFLRRARDAGWIVEACLSNRARCALLYAVNLTPGFFDLSSGDAGEILQKLRNYHVRLAIVRSPDSPPMSTRFGEMVEEERRGPHFGVFDTRAEAEAWLRNNSATEELGN